MDTKPKIIQETEIPLFELRREMAIIKKRDTELNFRTQKTDEYLNSFPTIKDSDLVKLSEELKKMEIPRLKDSHIFKITDILPSTAEDVKVVLQGYSITISQENVKKIADAVKKYLPEKTEKKAGSEEKEA